MRGSCHCGDVAFEVAGEPAEAYECNCSHCSRKGFLLWFAPRATFELKTPEAALTTYKFNKHVIDHRFCKRCGCQPFGLGKTPDGNEMAAINIRCLEGIDIAAVKPIPVDGKSF